MKNKTKGILYLAPIILWIVGVMGYVAYKFGWMDLLSALLFIIGMFVIGISGGHGLWLMSKKS